jgi:predicted phage tail protein
MGFFSDIIKGIGKLFNAILEPLLGWLVPKPPAKEGIKIDRQGSDNSIPIVYGTQKVGAIKVHKYVTDQAGGAKNEFLHLICVFAEGEVDAIEEVFFNGISENDTQWNKDGGGKWHRINRYIGSPMQTADSAAIAEIPNWTSLHKLSGLCYAYIRLELDKNQTVWRGEPQITARIRGRKLFDPRNSATAYSENPALVLRDYLTNSIYGKGLNPARLDSASFISAANFCDTSVTNTVTRTVCAGEFDINDEYTYSCTTETVTESKALFSCNIFLDTGQTVFDNIKEILGTFRGIMPLSAGSIKLSVERDGDPVFNFNDGNIVGSIDVDSGSINDRYNRVEVRFPNEAKDFENDSVFYPPDDDALASQWLDEDNGVRLEQSFEFTGITKKDEAIQMAEIIAKKSRFTKSVGFESQPIGIVVEAGDIVSLTNTMHGWIEKPFRVIEKTINDDDTVKFALVEHEDAIYPFSGATFNELSGGTFLGDPTKIPAPTSPNLQPDLTLAETGLLTWSYENNAFIRSYEVEITSGGSLILGLQSFGQSVIVPLLDSGSYVANIYAISSTGYRSPALAYSFNLTAPAQPSAITLTARDWEIDAQPVLAGIGIGTEFEFDIVQGDGTGYTPTAKAKGASYTASGLLPDTLYTVYARSVNAFGASAWASESATTTITGAQSQPFIDALQSEINVELSALDELLGGVDSILEEVAQDVQEVYARASVEERVRQAEIDNLAKAEALVNEYLEELQGETLPELNARLTVAEGEIDTLENVTIPAVNSRLDDAETEISTLNSTTIPQIESDLDVAQGQIATIQGEIFATTGSIPQTIDNALEELAQDIQEVYQRTDGVRSLNSLFPIEATSISDDAITTPKLAANSVTAVKIIAGAVSADKITANAVTADKIAANAVTADKILANSIGADKLTANSVTADKIVANAVTTAKINALAITGDKLAVNSVTADKIVSASITGDKIAANTISANNIVSKSITSDEIAASTITGDEIAANTISGDKIIANTIVGDLIAARTIAGSNMIAGTLTASEIAARTIQAVNIATDSITSTEIKAGTITAANIAGLTITGDKIDANTIGADKIVTNSLTSDQIATNAIKAINIEAGAITATKLSADAIDGKTITGVVVNAGTLNGGLVSGATVRGGTIETIGGTHMLVTSATPFNGLIQWYGLTAGNLSGGAPIYANLTKTNAIRWIDSAGEYSRDIVSRRNTTSTTTVSVTHPSQGSLITILGKGRVTASENFTVFNQPSFSGKITINYRLRKGATQVASGIYSSTLAFNVEQLDPSIWSLDIAFDIPLEIEYEETIGVTSQAYSFDITSVVVEADEAVTPTYKSQITTTEIRQ